MREVGAVVRISSGLADAVFVKGGVDSGQRDLDYVLNCSQNRMVFS